MEKSKETPQKNLEQKAPELFDHVQNKVLKKFKVAGFSLEHMKFSALDGSGSMCCHRNGSCNPC